MKITVMPLKMKRFMLHKRGILKNPSCGHKTFQHDIFCCAVDIIVLLKF